MKTKKKYTLKEVKRKIVMIEIIMSKRGCNCREISRLLRIIAYLSLKHLLIKEKNLPLLKD